MAYSDEAVLIKLSSLSETQDSIVASSQWLLFHRRHATRTAALWLDRLSSAATPAKKLNLIYLANEVVQQSRARGKTDFSTAFEPIIAEAVEKAYKGASSEVQGKVKRVVEVWRGRGVFGKGVVGEVEQRMAEIDKVKAGKGGGKLGGALFGGSGVGGVPMELEGAANLYTELTKAEVGKTPAVQTAETDYAKLMDPAAVLPTPPVHAARLSALMRALATAQGAVEASISVRKQLVAGLEKLVQTHQAQLAEEAAVASQLSIKREGIEAKKREVEDGIMRGLSAPASPSATAQDNGNGHDYSAAPEAEGFTPPPPDVESFTPPPAATEPDLLVPAALVSAPFPSDPQRYSATLNATPQPKAFDPRAGSAVDFTMDYTPPAFAPSGNPTADIDAAAASAQAADDFLASLSATTQQQASRVRQASAELPSDAQPVATSDPRLKRRKMSHRASDVTEDIFGTGNGIGAEGMGVDEEGISALLGA